ncbi:D-TA family PLP-dependent enzyme [Pseudarthrobacter sp. MDT3-28]|uniref:D-TA family PLP-dependent enzyme n=1 Tax=Pseudarthrobacter raffinosi TaxID=2953651 RepID=UPI00208FBDAE|nr:D-TA family PLP-dependent enzyme [Pseudarthrobacter sp. MDT3-28]MCO4239639.1 D-TA family PLP-dependent enzyme [Pseudarthrobacter sp. MDT3-28]
MTIPAEIDTPEIIIDRHVLQRNIDRMATAVRAKGLHLRPHVKTHKVPEIAEMQLAAGAVGLTVATLGEAEVFAEHGAKDIFIAYPLWIGPRQAERLQRLAAKARIAVGVDSREAAETMAASLGDAVGEIEVVLEIDSGHHRSGIAPDAVVGVAQAAARGGLRVTGIFTFPGHSYAPGMPLKAADEERLALGKAADLLTAGGFPITHRSGGSTPTATLTAGNSGATEVRPGVYVFGDAQQLELERCAVEDIALTVAATVVSRHEGTDLIPRRVILDSGSKILGGDLPGWTTGFGRLLDHPEARITALSEHHATVVWPAEATLPALGDRLRVVPNHVCIAMNLVDDVTVISGGEIVDRWHVAARGRNK